MNPALALLCCALLLTTASTASAQMGVASSLEPTPVGQWGRSHRRGGWEYAFEPYLWFPGVDGDSRVGAPGPFAVDMGFGGSNFGAMLAFEFGPRDRPWSLLFDALYLDVEADKRGIEFGYQQGFLEGMYAWEVPYQPETQLLAGVRAWALEPSIRMPASRAMEVEEEWVDPVVGFRYLMPGNTDYDLFLRADVGGFGVGSAITWQVAGGMRWHLNRNSTFGLGYRHMKLEYDDHGVELDITFSGPLVGLTWSR